MEIEEPVTSRNGASFDFHPALARVLGPTLIREEVVQVRECREKRLLATPGMMKALHREQFALDGVVGLIEQGACGRHLRVGEDRIPARLLGLKPAAYPRAVGWPCRGGDAVTKWRSRCPSATTRKLLRWRAR
ncbi:MAG: hypothetical protein AB7N91_30730 [Candidatus Tectimicrobiota bacterium]